ncbi:hypothetical protein [Streptomyces olivaceoviridis]|uniref:hypothetical protein n=1 Tax=Streptomyces olivaceoviridis TaxID=1921 RepID=UPI0036B715A7
MREGVHACSCSQTGTPPADQRSPPKSPARHQYEYSGADAHQARDLLLHNAHHSVGGPLDGLLLDITGWAPDEAGTGAALATELGQFGAGSRALYDPRSGDPDH